MVGVRVPGAAGELAEAVPEDRHELAARLDQPPGREGALAEQRHAVVFPDRHRLSPHVEGAVDRARGQQGAGELLLPAEGGDTLVLGLVQVSEDSSTPQRQIFRLRLGQHRIETNPIPVKQALTFMGRCANELRMPLCPMSAPAADRLKAAMKELKLI